MSQRGFEVDAQRIMHMFLPPLVGALIESD